MLREAARRAVDLGSETIGGLVPEESPLAVVLDTLSPRITPARHPMMMRTLIDDPAIEDAIARDPIRFWNADRV